MKTIKIFLASSEELKEERTELADLVERLNYTLGKQDIAIQLVKWEYLNSSMGPLHKQEEYNRELRECELCMVLYWTRFGMYTKMELDTAYQELCSGRNPKRLYVYFKDGEGISSDLREFRDGFSSQYGHFYRNFRNIDTLKAEFLLQFMDYLNVYLKDVIEIKDSKVTINGKVYVNLQNVPFAGNNEEYNLLLKSIKNTKKILSVTEEDDPEYAECAAELKELEEKQSQMESSLWDTALMVTRLSTTKCSERLQRAMELFGKGDNKGAQAILNEEEIEKDVQHNLHLLELGEEGKKGLQTNIEEFQLKIKTLRNEMSEGWLDQILSIQERILSLTISLYGENSKEAADELDEIENVNSEKGYYSIALEYGLKALEIRTALFGERHLDTAASFNNVGVAYGKLGEHKKTLEYEIKALEISKELLGERDLNTATIYNNIGRAYRDFGDYRKALRFMKKALEIRKELLGERHPETALSFDNVGIAYGNLGQYKKALEYENKALEIIKELFGERHPDTATLYGNIGRAYGNLGQYKKALEYENKALEIIKELFGERHPDTATLYNNIGCAYGNNGDHKKALEFQIKALEIRKDILGEHHPDTATLYNNIGYEYGELGEHKKALEFQMKALEIRRDILGEHHRQTATSYKNVGNDYAALGIYEKGIEYIRKALAIVSEIGDKRLFATYNNRVARSYLAAGDIANAKEYFERASKAFKDCGMEEDYKNNLEELNKING